MIGPEGGDAAYIINECRAGRCFNRNTGDRIVAYMEELFTQFINGSGPSPDMNALKEYSRKYQALHLKDIIQA
jgi:hypothetical protein